MRTTQELISLIFVSLPLWSSFVRGQEQLHERRVAKGDTGNIQAQVVTQTLTTFVTVTAAAVASSGTTSTTSTASSATTSIAVDSTANSGFPQNGTSLDVSLIPAYGIQQGVSLDDGTANCAGLNDKAIPCDCPPDPSDFVSSLNTLVTSGAEEFPTGDAVADQLTRLEACIVALQNVFGGPGSGVGCPAVSTNWTELLSELQAETKLKLW